MYNRWVENSIKNALKTRRIVILSGSRQCGKTTLAKMLINNNCVYRTLDDIALFKAAQNDPHGFVKNLALLMKIILLEIFKKKLIHY